MELMVRDMEQLSHIECSTKRAKWTEVLAALKLTPTQREQLMANRKAQFNKLRTVYQERQELNMQVSCCCSQPLRSLLVLVASRITHYSCVSVTCCASDSRGFSDCLRGPKMASTSCRTDC